MPTFIFYGFPPFFFAKVGGSVAFIGERVSRMFAALINPPPAKFPPTFPPDFQDSTVRRIKKCDAILNFFKRAHKFGEEMKKLFDAMLALFMKSSKEIIPENQCSVQ